MEKLTRYGASYQVYEKGFFVVKQEGGVGDWKRVPCPVFLSLDEARAEAQRMAARNGGEYVNLD